MITFILFVDIRPGTRHTEMIYAVKRGNMVTSKLYIEINIKIRAVGIRLLAVIGPKG